MAGLFKGMASPSATSSIPKRVVTREYPENRDTLTFPERFRGQVVMPHDEQGDHNCTACTLCEKACPNGSISILTTKNIASKRVLGQFVYRLSSCTLCNLCIEACPFDAIKMGHGFEMASYDREDLDFDPQQEGGPLKWPCGDVFFYGVGAVLLALALVTVTARNLFRAALSLLGVLWCTAMLFILLKAEMVALVQVMVYIGGIMIFVLYAVLLTSELGGKMPRPSGFPAWPAACWPPSPSSPCCWPCPAGPRGPRWTSSVPAPRRRRPISPPSRPWASGSWIRVPDGFLIPFELISVVLLAAMVGAIALARQGGSRGRKAPREPGLLPGPVRGPVRHRRLRPAHAPQLHRRPHVPGTDGERGPHQLRRLRPLRRSPALVRGWRLSPPTASGTRERGRSSRSSPWASRRRKWPWPWPSSSPCTASAGTWTSPDWTASVDSAALRLDAAWTGRRRRASCCCPCCPSC